MVKHNRAFAALAIVLALSGCAVMESHDKKTAEIATANQKGGIPAALAQLESTAKSKEEKTALLYNMERGELLRMNRQYAESSEAFLLADVQVRAWEESTKTNPDKLLGVAGASLISERLKVYEGQDYEKVWLTTRLALNRVAAGDFENARVDIKRTHEREAIIAAFRAKETGAAEEEAKSKGVTAKSKEVNGYPVETLNDPEVLALKNGYQNALSHYLAGFLYEAMNEPGLAAPGYRQAIELKPDTAILEEGLRGLDDRTSFTHKRKQKMTDVLFVVETGDAPARKPKGFTLPIPVGKKIRTVSISYPIIEPSKDALLTTMAVADKQFPLERVVDVNVMARRALKDEMPGLVVRGVIRAIAKGAMQEQLEKSGGLLGAIIGSVASAVTEQADDRIWRMLPGRVYVARGYLPPGDHSVAINGRNFKVSVDGQYALVPLRFYNSSILTGDVGKFGVLPVLAEVAVPNEVAADANPAASPIEEVKIVKKTSVKASETKVVYSTKVAPKLAAVASTTKSSDGTGKIPTGAGAGQKQAASSPAKAPVKVAEKAPVAAVN
jgi:hypothetical protein